MSTDLYGVRILGVSRKTKSFRVRVFVVYYDVSYKNHQPIPEDHSFFLRILWDQVDVRFNPPTAVGEAIDLDQFLTEEYIDSNTFRYIERVEKLVERNSPLKNYKGYSDFYYERDGQWNDEEKLVQADYEVYVTDEKYLEGLTLGASFGTTSYETQADTLSLADAPFVPDFRLEHKRLTPFTGGQEEGTPSRASFSDDSQYLVVSSEAGAAVVYDTKDFSEVLRIPKTKLFEEAHFSPGTHLLHLHEQTWDLKTKKKVKTSYRPGRHYRSSSGKYYASAGEDGTVKFFNKASEITKEFKTDLSCAEAVAFNQDETQMAVGGMGEEIYLFHPETGALLRKFKCGSRIFDLSSSPSGDYLFAALQHPARHTVAAIRVRDGAIVRGFNAERTSQHYPERRITRYPACSPNGRWLSVAHLGEMGYGGYVSIYTIGDTWPAANHNDRKKPREHRSSLDSALMKQLAQHATPKSQAELDAMLKEHKAFLASGGADGSWDFVEAAGFTLAIYQDAVGAKGKQAVLRFANLQGLTLKGVALPFSDFVGVYLENGDLSGANLEGCAATDGYLPRVNFAGAKLSKADFSRSMLQGANFRDADLRGTDFERCDLTGADFTDANIAGIKLSGAIVEGIKGFGEKSGESAPKKAETKPKKTQKTNSKAKSKPAKTPTKKTKAKKPAAKPTTKPTKKKSASRDAKKANAKKPTKPAATKKSTPEKKVSKATKPTKKTATKNPTRSAELIPHE